MSSASSSGFFTTADEAISRAALDELLSNDQVLHRFEHCVFDDEDLERVDLRGVVFRKQTVKGLNMSGADLAGCDFSDAVLVGCDLTNANLRDTKFGGADLRDARLGEVRIGDLLQYFNGSTISSEQAAALVAALGVNVI